MRRGAYLPSARMVFFFFLSIELNNCGQLFKITGNYIRYCHKMRQLPVETKKREYLEKELRICDL